MTAPARSSTHNVGRFTGLVLGLVVFVCIVMIGIAGYIEYELDRAESVLAAPEAASGDQDSYDQLRRGLGYSGYVGLAQNYAASHDANTLKDMKTQIKAMDEIINHLPEKTPVETRRDLVAIVATFDATQARAEKSASDPATSFTLSDIAPLYAALPVLDSRITSAAAVNRLTAQTHLQFWALLLMLVSWVSLIIAAAMSVGIYLSLRDRNSAPMRALAQSIKNMAHGDLRTSIWGMERSDMVGELARAIDMARYNFSQLPDMSLISDKGPVRLRFEGNTKSMFEAMMQLITRDSEQVRQQATGLTDAVMKQQQALTQMSGQVETILHGILQRGQTGDQQVKQVVHDLTSSATALKRAQEHAADQLNRIVPFLQERAQGLSEITHITGKQVSQVLQNLILTERGLKTSAEQSEIAINKLSTTADDLGNRLFGAVNLLQASGKVLAETTESTQSRLNEAIEKLHGTVLQSSSDVASPFAGDTVGRLETLISSLESAHQKLEHVMGEQTQAAKAQIEILTTHSSSLLAQSTTAAQTLSTVSDHMRSEQDRFDQTIHQISERLDAIGSRLEQSTSNLATPQDPAVALVPNETQVLLGGISTQIWELAESLSALHHQPSAATDTQAPTGDLLLEIKSGFETTVRSLAQMREQLTNMVINAQAQAPMAPVATPTDNHWQQISMQIEISRNSLSNLVTQQIERLEKQLLTLTTPSEPTAATLPRDAQEQMEQQTQILTELVATLAILDEHMQQIKTDMHAAKA